MLAGVTPTVFYRDPIAAMRFLEAAFGFETTMLVTDDQGRVGHAEMQVGPSSINIGGEFGAADLIGPAAMRSPASAEGVGTQFLRIHLSDGLDAHCERARAAGARITQEPAEQFYGSRVYRALDPEGHVWNFDQQTKTMTTAEMEAASGLAFRTSL